MKAPVEVLVIDHVEKPSRTDPSIFGGIVSKSVSFEPSPESLQAGHLTRVKYQVHNEAMKYGYARVSTDDQNPALQLAALKKAGCQTVFKVKDYREPRPSALPCSAA